MVGTGNTPRCDSNISLKSNMPSSVSVNLPSADATPVNETVRTTQPSNGPILRRNSSTALKSRLHNFINTNPVMQGLIYRSQAKAHGQALKLQSFVTRLSTEKACRHSLIIQSIEPYRPRDSNTDRLK